MKNAIIERKKHRCHFTPNVQRSSPTPSTLTSFFISSILQKIGQLILQVIEWSKTYLYLKIGFLVHYLRGSNIKSCSRIELNYFCFFPSKRAPLTVFCAQSSKASVSERLNKQWKKLYIYLICVRLFYRDY